MGKIKGIFGPGLVPVYETDFLPCVAWLHSVKVQSILLYTLYKEMLLLLVQEMFDYVTGTLGCALFMTSNVSRDRISTKQMEDI